jgi:prolyl-tRNA synthetase
MVRGDRSVNEIKVVNALGIAEHELRLATYDEILSLGSVEGFVGPMGLTVKTLVDSEVASMKNIVVGANKKDAHLMNVNFGRDFTGEVLQIRSTVAGDVCPVCGAPLAMERGIEVGQIFKLGTKYSLPMNCTYQNDSGQNVPMVMGCYGIGVTRTMSSIIEQYHDDYGIKWPLNVAPYHAVVVPINYNDETMKEKADMIYNELRASGAEVILDDRDAKPGFKFKDWELIGIPYMIVVGKRAAEGICEFKNRATLEKEEITFEEAINRIKNLEIK